MNKVMSLATVVSLVFSASSFATGIQTTSVAKGAANVVVNQAKHDAIGKVDDVKDGIKDGIADKEKSVKSEVKAHEKKVEHKVNKAEHKAKKAEKSTHHKAKEMKDAVKTDAETVVKAADTAMTE